MAEDELIEIVEDDEERVDPEAYAAARRALEERCKPSGIEVVERYFVDGEKYLAVGMPNGREKRWISLFRLEQFHELLAVPFEHVIFLGDYLATCSYQDGQIEAMVRGAGPMGTSMVSRRLFGIPLQDLDQGNDEKRNIELYSKDAGSEIRMRVASISGLLKAISRGPYSPRSSLSLQIKGLQFSNHDHALNLLNKLSNSLFFQIDMALGVPLGLVKERRPIRAARRPKRKSEIGELQFPKTEYDEAPISLYWYARSAIGMPLLQFLAYYQVIEFYFFSYSQEDARRKIQGILKDPTFRLDRDADVGRLLSAMGARGRGFGDERSQLRSTLNACVDAAELRKYLTEFDERSEFFSNRQKGLTNHKLPLSNKDADLRNEVADLIYDIRCKIVHTKGEAHEGELELLLPFSKEADLLFQDIELLQYLARQVLISASSPIRY